MGKPTLVSARFAVAWHVLTNNPLFSLSRIYNCFNIFTKSKAFHGIIFQEKSFTITLCKPCKLFVNLWTLIFFSVPKVYNGFKGEHYPVPFAQWRFTNLHMTFNNKHTVQNKHKISPTVHSHVVHCSVKERSSVYLDPVEDETIKIL